MECGLVVLDRILADVHILRGADFVDDILGVVEARALGEGGEFGWGVEAGEASGLLLAGCDGVGYFDFASERDAKWLLLRGGVRGISFVSFRVGIGFVVIRDHSWAEDDRRLSDEKVIMQTRRDIQ